MDKNGSSFRAGGSRSIGTDGSKPERSGPSWDSGASEDHGGHCLILDHKSARLSRNSRPVIPRARLRALTTRSKAGSSCWLSRNDSRIARRILLRSTPLPATLMDTASPSRGPFVSLGRIVNPKCELDTRRPDACSASNCALRLMRLGAGKVYRRRSGEAGIKADAYGMSFLRPLARRRLRTRRPALVAIRARNPCVRARRTLLG